MSYLNRLHPRLILASASPRRSQLLKQIGLEFEVIPSNVDESAIFIQDAAECAKLAALAKARSVAKQMTEGLVIGADTVVVEAGEAIGKPGDMDDAVRILTRLSGKTHEVITGIVLISVRTGKEDVWAETTKVTFRELSDVEIREYVETKEPLDKAGAYGIQGRAAAFVSRIEGCYFNVVGLPLASLVEKLKRYFYKNKFSS